MKTNVAIVVDASGSMSGLEYQVRKMVGGIFETLTKVEQETGQVYLIDLWTFSDRNHINRHCISTRPQNWNVGDFTYRTDGMTALFDATLQAANKLPAVSGKDANLVIVVTDGQENSSTTRLGTFEEKIRAFLRTNRYTFVIHVPPGNKKQFIQVSSFPADNVNEWERTEVGTTEVEQKTSGGILAYAAKRATGQTQSSTYFTDASNISSRDLYNKRALNFKEFTAAKETVAKECAERYTNNKYVIGQLFYQLIKPERVQENKEVVIQDKATKFIYAGPDIRKLIGIPVGKKVKVDPGNHAMYDVFIQSTSVNRIIPRGTKVLIDTNRLSDLPPTWDHTKVVKKPSNLTQSEKQLLGIK